MRGLTFLMSMLSRVKSTGLLVLNGYVLTSKGSFREKILSTKIVRMVNVMDVS